MKIRLSIAGAWMKSLDVTAPASPASADPGAAIIEGRANSALDMAVLGGDRRGQRDRLLAIFQKGSVITPWD